MKNKRLDGLLEKAKINLLPVKSKISLRVAHVTFWCRNNKTIISMAMLSVAMIISFWIFANTIANALKPQKSLADTEETNEEASMVSLPTADVKDLGEYTLYTYLGKKKVHLNRHRGQDLAYIAKYSELATRSAEINGIPASIKLAQGLLETKAGTSMLAFKHNNHFGMKCWEKDCGVNMHDDDPLDRFFTYDSPAESWAAHDKLLVNGERYQNLFKFGRGEYKSWAIGLKKAGYATSPYYAVSLIALIEEYRLQSFDE